MKSAKLVIAGIVAVGAMFGALAASAAPLPSMGTPANAGASQVVPTGYYCWWSYGYRHCGYRHRHYYRRYYY